MSDALKPQLHGRDHRPGGRDPIPLDVSATFPWVRLGQYSRTVSDSTWTKVPFRFLEYDPTITNVSTTDFSWTEVSDGLGHKIWQVTTRKEGFYLYDLRVSCDTTGTNTNDGGVGLRLTNSTGNSIDEIYTGSDWFKSTTFTSGYEGETEQGNGMVRLAGLIYISESSLDWIPQVIQTTGSSKAIGGEYLLIARLMTTSGAGWTSLTST